MKYPVKILYVNGNIMKRGGIESFMMNYYRQFDPNIIHVDFIVHGYEKGVFDDEITERGNKIYHVPTKSKHPLKYQKELRKIFDTGEYKIVHSHLDAMSAWVLKIAKESGVPIRIAHSHNTNHLTTNKVKYLLNEYARKKITKYSTHNFACSEEAGKWLFGNNEFSIVPNAIEIDKFKFDDSARKKIRNEFGFNDNDFVFGNVARFDTQKNHEFLIFVFSEVVKSCSDARLLLIGEGWLMQSIRDEVRTLRIEDKVVFAGSRDDVNAIYSAMDAFVLPSKFEGLGIVGIEAQANGLIALISDAVPHQVKISNLVTFIPLSKNSWKDSMIEAYKAEKKHYSVNLSQSEYDIKSEAKKMQQMYCEMVNK